MARALPDGADGPMRNAVRNAYLQMAKVPPDYFFSGWGGRLTAAETGVAFNRVIPVEERLHVKAAGIANQFRDGGLDYSEMLDAMKLLLEDVS